LGFFLFTTDASPASQFQVTFYHAAILRSLLMSLGANEER
jgi:hypothetical protein